MNKITISTLIAVLLLVSACGPKTNNSAKTAQQQPTATGPVFRISTMPAITGGDVTSNWCYGSFGASLVVNAEKENVNRRYFYLGNGVTKINIGRAGMVSAYFLRPLADGSVEVFTGTHFPECLSMPENFSLTNGGRVLHYENLKNMHYNLEIRTEEGHPLITVDLPADVEFGLSMNVCSNCQ